MLENRPITQKALYGGGAFAFVFLAAMAGTAFMISGGFGFGGDRADAARPHIVSLQDWGEWHAFDEPTPVRLAPMPARVEEPAAVEMTDALAQEDRSDDLAAASTGDESGVIAMPADEDLAPSVTKPADGVISVGGD